MTPDEELFREWQQGAVGALEALVRRHHSPLLAHLVRLTGNPALAEDLYDKLSTCSESRTPSSTTWAVCCAMLLDLVKV